MPVRFAALLLALVLLQVVVAGCGGTDDEDSTADTGASVAEGGAVSFGYKGAWLAIRSSDASAVADALGLTSVREAAWEEAFAAIDSRESDPPFLAFVTPPIDGWTLVALGHGLEQDDAGGRLDFASLSRRFGEVQKFASHRVVDYHEWQRWVAGEPVRRYLWIGESGEIPFDEGEPAAAEGNILRLANLADEEWDEYEFPDEETVMAVAAEWSIDPTTIAERSAVDGTGLLGEIDR